jgi:hypothetical protein
MISANIARINRMRRKPPTEIATYIVKRSKIAIIHLSDRIRLGFGEISISEANLLKKISLKETPLPKVRSAVNQIDVEKAKRALILHMRDRKAPRFFFDPSKPNQLALALDMNFPNSRTESLAKADKVLEHKFELLGQEVVFGNEIDWHFSLGNKRWPLIFSPNIDYLSSKKPGDIKIPWELNRTQHFVTLGKAFWYTADEKYAKEFTEELLSWIRDNPYKLGINWMEGIETSIRLISWSWAYSFFLKSKSFEKAHFEFLKSVYMQTRFIERHLSDKWQLNNNHLIAEAAGLVIVGILFPEFSEAHRWVKKGLTIIEREIEKQILRDGFTWEYSTGYQKFITDLVLLVVVIMQKNNMEIPEKLTKKLGAMIDFLYSATKPDGMIPLIGDDDDGRALKLTDSAYTDTGLTLALGSYLYPNKNLPRTKPEEMLWLLSEKNIDETKSPASNSSRLFKDSGLFVMRNKKMFLMFIAGPQKPKYAHAPHHHQDELSFVLNAYGVNFIVDSGTFTYNGDLNWRKYFKGRTAHNTSVIDEQNPVPVELFETNRIPTTEIGGFQTNKEFEWISSKYTGYKDLTHVRQIFFVKSEYWLILDYLKGSGNHTYDIYFHFNHDLEAKFDDAHNVLVSNAESTLKIIPAPMSGLNSEIIDTEISPQYGIKNKACALKLRKKGPAPQIFATVLLPFKKGLTNETLAVEIKTSFYPTKQESAEKNEEIRIDVVFREHSDHFVCSNLQSNNHVSGFFREPHK